MTVTFTVPESLEKQLQAQVGPDVGRAAKEALAIDLYRQEKLSLGQVAELLGLSVNGADGLLKGRGVESLYSVEDLEANRASIRKALGR